jgi:hypothetical protein
VGSLIQSGTTLYGMTAASSMMFQIGTDGTGFSLLHRFTGGSDGGYSPGSLIQSGSTLYGMTALGGDPYLGVIFSIAVPEPSGVGLGAIGIMALAAYGWRMRRRAQNSRRVPMAGFGRRNRLVATLLILLIFLPATGALVQSFYRS